MLRLLTAAAATMLGLVTAWADTPTRVMLWQSPAGGRLEDATFTSDGLLLVAGQVDAMEGAAVGPIDNDSRYAMGYIGQFSVPDDQPVRQLLLSRGLTHVTTVIAGDREVYVGGYAVQRLADAVKARIDTDGPVGQMPLWAPRPHWTDPLIDDRRTQRGRPMVLRLSRDLSEIRSGVLLAGWQSVWHVPKPLGEDRWQPTGLARLHDGDLVVVHDGGYMREPDKDQKPDARHFYHVPDHVSRLSSDLSQTRWTRKLYTPTVDRAKVEKYVVNPWPHDDLGNTRVLRTRSAADGKSVYVAGWSPTMTSHEPWWSPFLFKLDGQGRIAWRAYNPDPMSGGGDRMGGDVSDSAIRSVNVDHAGNVLFAGIADGGNSVLRKDPRDYTQQAPMRADAWGFKGRTLFWGVVGRLDDSTQALEAGVGILGRHQHHVAAAWPIDLAGLPDGRVVVVGRHTRGFGFTDDAWHRSESAGGFFRIYDARFRLEYSTSLPGVDPMAIAVHGHRIAIVGAVADPSAEPDSPTTKPDTNPLRAYLLVIDVPAEAQPQPNQDSEAPISQ